MWTKILKTVLAWLVRNARWNTYLSPVPIGVRLGGRDDTQLPDQFRIIELELAGLVIFRGYWQNQ
jgi:hypothetical protein